MNIGAIRPAGSQAVLAAQEAILDLDQRVLEVGALSKTSLDDPNFEAFYQRLLAIADDGLSGATVYECLRAFEADGAHPYRTTETQAAVLALTLQRLKEDSLQDTALYKSVTEAQSRVFSTKFMVQEYMQQIFMVAEELPEW
ncbi:hypothetical protein C4J93_2177 [Pseudomonas sp. R2-37-08W]|uniref:hypothetical protein n=1 Tax=unclassified Pseudomonas TaxID=196821 RepID=UPI000F575B0A|nr:MULTISPECIES: hypothetical protein [unclassified Pseudomonas]AZF10375.1 hypothetical protein C4J93_2177 [Pseudomonas sp. R2-37-08W]AZF20908.1 hypothetical protein C4J91_2158 [Pseudomonas sp. R3-52-08]MDQ0741093.1 hypothetical protein [Pseudomonas sp. W4I3]